MGLEDDCERAVESIKEDYAKAGKSLADDYGDIAKRLGKAIWQKIRKTKEDGEKK